MKNDLVRNTVSVDQSADQWDAKLYEANHSFVHQLGQELIELLDPRPGERILDLGCGTGPLTQQIANAGALVVGIDSSEAMIGQAKKAFPLIHFEVQNAVTMRFDEPFDAIFSNAALHWVKPPEAVIEQMSNALKPGGRLVLEMGGQGNIARISAAAIEAGREMKMDLRDLINVNYFPSIGEYAALLEHARFQLNFATLFDRPTPLSDGEAGLRNWMRMFRPAVETAIAADLRDAFFDRMSKKCVELKRDGTWYADYRRLRVVARRN